MTEIIPRKVFEIGMIGCALVAGLSALEGYKNLAVGLELAAFFCGFMIILTPGTQLRTYNV